MGASEHFRQTWGRSWKKNTTTASDQAVDDCPLAIVCPLLNLLAQGLQSWFGGVFLAQVIQ
jgi:hypothetical protein